MEEKLSHKSRRARRVNMNDMQRLGEKHNTDKVWRHKYHEIFPTYIEKFYRENGGLIEIGLKDGASLNMWTELFPNMHIYGLSREAKDEVADRHTVLQCDQSDQIQLDHAVKKIKHPIHFINDDGSHIPEHQLLTFNKLFPVLEIGGVYIIEDIETSYWTKGGLYGYKTRYGKGNKRSIVEIFKNTVDAVNYKFSKSAEGEVQHQKQISAVCFEQNCIIIKKRNPVFEEYEFKNKL